MPEAGLVQRTARTASYVSFDSWCEEFCLDGDAIVTSKGIWSVLRKLISLATHVRLVPINATKGNSS